MKMALVKIAWKQVIDIAAKTDFEKKVFHDSYHEFLMKAQTYNTEKKFTSFAEMVNHEPKANSLHYEVGFSVGLYINELNGVIPGAYDTLGLVPIRFTAHKFQVIASDINDRSAHKVAIIYITEQMSLLDNFGDNLLLSYGNKFEGLAETGIMEPVKDSFILKISPEISIINYCHLSSKIIAQRTYA
jgi:hypothetical protein